MKKQPLVFLFMLQVLYCAAQPAGMKPGVERWPVKTSVVSSEEGQPVALTDLFTLGDAPGVSRNDARFQSARIPAFPNEKNLTEGEIISTEGWLHLVAWEPDGDYHMQISADAENGDHCLIAEVPLDDAAYVSDSNLRSILHVTRSTVDQILGHPAAVSGTVLPTAVFVRVTGQLFYDDSHVGAATQRGKKGMHAVNLWELHPVTSIEVLSGTAPFTANLASPPANNNSITTNSPTMQPIQVQNTIGDFLLVILLAAILGMAGQIVRLMVGLKKATQDAPPNADGSRKTTIEVIDGKQLAISLLIALVVGAIAGVLAAVNNLGIHEIDKATIFVFLAAGYAGTDLIEGFVIKR